MLQFGWIGSNFNSIAMEPLGHVAGTASSVQGFMQTVGGGVIGAVIGQAFDGTVDAAGGRLLRRRRSPALVFVLIAEKGRLFRRTSPAGDSAGGRRPRPPASGRRPASPAKSNSLRSSRCDGRTLASARIIVSLRPGMRVSMSASIAFMALRCSPSWLPHRSQGMIGNRIASANFARSASAQ